MDLHAAEADTAMSGWARLDYFSSSRTLDADNNFLAALAAFKLTHTFANDQRFELEAWLRSEDLTRTPSTTVRWVNAYWFARTERIDLRVGQQAIRWGKADG